MYTSPWDYQKYFIGLISGFFRSGVLSRLNPVSVILFDQDAFFNSLIGTGPDPVKIQTGGQPVVLRADLMYSRRLPFIRQ